MEEIINNEFGERLRLLIFKTNHNLSSFGAKVGVSHTAISKIVKGDNKPRYSLIDSILKSFPEVNKGWLLDGEGEMFTTPVSQQPTPDNYLQEHLKNLEKQFAEMREIFSAELSVKNRQIEKLMDLLGKPECVTETGVLEHPATAAMLLEEIGLRA